MSNRSEATSLFHFAQQRGRHAVGLRVVEQYDCSRPFRPRIDALGRVQGGERARPLQTLIWYPAERVASEPMSVNDYLDLWATETSYGAPRMSAAAKEWREAMRPALSMRLWAVRDAPPASGNFPVVIYAPSFSGVAWENADLCEFLASHGYVVLAAPSMGVSTREMTRDVSGINAQARDISFLIGYARQLPGADASHVAVAGFSWGGISSLFAWARDDRVAALVALDGSLRAYPGLVRQAGDVHPEEAAIPLLSFSQRYWSEEDLKRYVPGPEREGPDVLDKWVHGDLFNVTLLRLTHTEFSSMYQRNEAMWWKIFNVWPHMKAGYDRQDGIAGYGWVARYTLQFLDAYLKLDPTATAFLRKSPEDAGVPPDVMTSMYRPAAAAPASFEGFREEVGRCGFSHASDIYAAMRRRSDGFEVTESVLHAWSEELIEEGRLPEAIALLELNVRVHPESATAHTSLGSAYRAAGQRGPAIDQYRSALERDPWAADARIGLDELTSHPAG